ncbi:MAG: 6-hydroxymethyl-7,8-dihydropterin pyrophosphokinase [Methanobacterium sp.]|nr:MAG: 6-hydroxymethyl-7,8-dihydropterin pyrophosphokinase [Methanobacterium sp.]
MELEVWMGWYEEILKKFGFNKEDDEKTARRLNEILSKGKALSLSELPSGENFIVFGAGPSLKKHVKSIKKVYSTDFILVAADGATTALLEEDMVPHIIVTDLDGNIDDLIIANNKNACMVVHAHGNNLENILKYSGSLKKVIGTTQSVPLKYVHNFGGFTDGDRAVFLAVQLGAKKLILAGMDFGKVVSKYSRPEIDSEVGPAGPIKELKLEYAEKLIQWIIKNEKVEVCNLKHSNLEKFLELK